MKNMNKNLIIFGLLTTFVFSTVIMPVKASAHTFGRDGVNVWEDDSVAPYQQPATPTPTPDPSINVVNTITGGQTNNVVINTPIIASLNPAYVYKCTDSKNISIIGKYFIPSSIAKWNGSPRVTTYINSKNLVMQLTSTDVCGSGNYLITVDNGPYNGGLSNGVYFAINKAQGSATSLDLGANAISSGFMPSNIFEWFLLFLIILLIIILIRKMFFNKKITLQVLNLTATSVTLGATGLIANSIYVFEISGALGTNKVQVVAAKNGTANATFANLASGNHYTATIKKHDPNTGLLSNIPDAPVIYFDTLKNA